MNLENPKLALEAIERQIAETTQRLKALRKIRAGLRALTVEIDETPVPRDVAEQARE